MIPLLRHIFRTGILTEPMPEAEGGPQREIDRLHDEILNILGRALTIREVDAGSCNACELEIHALNNPYYNLEGRGIKFVASPRHADMLLVSGPVTKNMENALLRAYECTPDPKLVVAIEAEDVDTWLSAPLTEAAKLLKLAPVETFAAQADPA